MSDKMIVSFERVINLRNLHPDTVKIECSRDVHSNETLEGIINSEFGKIANLLESQMEYEFPED